MGGAGGFFTLLGFAFLAFVGFVIYFVFKQVQFVIQAIDLYKDMVRRLDKIVDLLSAGSNPNQSVSAARPTFQRSRGEPISPDAAPYVTFLVGLGYGVEQEGGKWTIRLPSGGNAFAYSVEDLKQQVDSASRKYGVQFQEGRGQSTPSANREQETVCESCGTALSEEVRECPKCGGVVMA